MTTAAKFWGPIAATIVVVALAYGPMLVAFFQNQWQHPQYQFFPFVLGAFAWLLWRSCAQSSPKGEGERREGRVGMILLLGAAWGLLALAYVANSPWLAIVSAVLLVASRFVRVAGTWRVEYLWGIWAMLLLLVPLPLNRDQWLINRLQHISSRLSSFFLDWLGVHHLMDGNALRLPEKEFFVDEACSGIVSVMSVIACAVIYGIWRNRSPLHVLLLAVAGVAWATFMNVSRITTIAVAYAWWGVDWSSGAAHETLGLFVFTITFLALVSTDYLLVAILAPVVRPGGEGSDLITYGRRLVAWFDRMQVWGAPRPEKVVAAAAARIRTRHEMWSRFAMGLVPLLAFGTLAAAQFAVPPLMGLAYEPPPPHRMERALELDEKVLSDTIDGMQRLDFDTQERDRGDIFGQHSRLFRYRDEEGNIYVVSCDFPFGPEWHDLRVCYTGAGWSVSQTKIHSPSVTEENSDWNYVVVDFAKPEGSAGHLVYCAFDERGTHLIPPSESLAAELVRSFQRGYQTHEPARFFQIQVWTTAPGKVNEQQSVNALKLLLVARTQLYNSITQSGATIDGGER